MNIPGFKTKMFLFFKFYFKNFNYLGDALMFSLT